MTLAPAIAPRRAKPRTRQIVIGAAVLVLLVAMAVDTTVVRIGSDTATAPGVFSAAAYGQAQFPKVQSAVADRAVDAATLAAALGKDRDAAVKQYGNEASAGPVFSVKFAGTVGKSDFGTVDVAVPNLPVAIHLRTGPAVLGTDLRDATGAINFGQFTNQIDYQNAGSALNKEMKKQVLAKVDTANLSGKTVAVVGAFQLTDPSAWTVTPVSLEVK